MKQAIAAAISTARAAVAFVWALGRRVVGLRPKRAARAEKSASRRRYAIGAASRETFDATMKKTRRRRHRR